MLNLKGHYDQIFEPGRDVLEHESFYVGFKQWYGYGLKPSKPGSALPFEEPKKTNTVAREDYCKSITLIKKSANLPGDKRKKYNMIDWKKALFFKKIENDVDRSPTSGSVDDSTYAANNARPDEEEC